jgi:Cytoskeletal adhesion
MSGLTYLTFHIEKLAMQTTEKLSAPLLTVSVYDSGSGKRVEKAQDITAPVITRPSYLWWSANWHMQNPLENMGPGCMVVFEFKVSFRNWTCELSLLVN